MIQKSLMLCATAIGKIRRAASIFSPAKIFSVILATLLIATVFPSSAGQERYDYDPIGRLIRYVDTAGQVTEYNYDAAGNIVSVQRLGAASSLTPTLATITPSFIRRGETKPLTITGQRLQAGILQTSDPGLDLSNVRQSATQIQANLIAGLSAATGLQTLTFANAEGAASIGINVGPVLPDLLVEPSPLAFPPDNVSRAVTVRLSSADVVSHQINIASSDSNKFAISQPSVTIAAGGTSVLINVTAKTSGFVNLILTSSTLKTLTVPVFLTADFRGVSTSNAQAVGVIVGSATPTSSALTVTATVSGGGQVGVVVGAVLTNIEPKALPVGVSSTLVVRGFGIVAGTSVAIAPSTSLVLGSSTVAADGLSISVPISIDALAAPGVRAVVVRDALGNRLPFSDANQSQLILTSGQPVIESIEPMFATPGATAKLKVRGKHLQNGRVIITPDTDLRVDSQPVINADGTEIVVNVQISALAVRGARTVRVITPSGQSTDLATAANQWTLVSEIQPDIGPIFAYPVGIVVGASTATGLTETISPVAAQAVGVAVGAYAKSMNPKVGVIGTTITLTVTGQGLQAVQSVSVQTTTGLTLGSMTIAPDGSSLSLPIGVAIDAPKSLRRIALNTANGPLAFSNANEANLLIAAPAPELISAAPQVIKAGQTATLVLRGVNLRDVSGVRFEPPLGVSALLAPIANTEGTELSVLVQAAANAITGPRTAIVVTAGGESSAQSSAANTVYVAQQVGATYAGIIANSVGVMVGSPTLASQTTVTYDAIAPLVGILVQTTPEVVTTDRLITASNLGVVVGSAITSLSPTSPDGILKGNTVSLVVTGYGLDQVTQARLIGAGTQTMSIGSFNVNQQGTQLTVPVSVSNDVTSGSYGLALFSGSGTATARIATAGYGSTEFKVGALPSAIASVAPIVMEQGKTYTFTVRGIGLKDVYQITTDPAGLEFGYALTSVVWATDSFGEKLTVSIKIDGNAPIGSRVIRLIVPGGITDATPVPANTITIIAPQ